MAARTGNLPQLGRHAAERRAGRAAARPRARQRRRDGAREQRHRGGRGGDQDRPRRHRPTAHPLCRARLPRADARLAVAQRRSTIFRDGFGPLLPGCDAVPFGDLDALERELARGDVAAFVVEPVQGKGVQPARRPGYLPGAQRLCRDAGTLLVCDEVQTGLGRTGRFLALEHWGLRAGHDLRLQGPLRRDGADRRGARLARGVRPRVRRHGARRAPRLDLRRQRPRRRRRRWRRCGCSTRRTWSRAPSAWARCCWSSRSPLVERYEVVRDVRGLGLMWAIEFGPPAGAAARSAVGDASSARQPGLFSQLVTVPLFHEHRIFCQVAGHRMNVIKALPAARDRGGGDPSLRRRAGGDGRRGRALSVGARRASACAWRPARCGTAAYAGLICAVAQTTRTMAPCRLQPAFLRSECGDHAPHGRSEPELRVSQKGRTADLR